MIQVDAVNPRFHITGQQISPRSLPEGIREHIDEVVPLGQGISEIEAMLRRAKANGGAVKLTLPGAQDVARLMDHEIGEPYQNITAIYWSLSQTALDGVIDQVRTTLVELVAEMRAGMPDAAEAPSADVADQAVNVAAHGKKARVNVTSAQASGEGAHHVQASPAESEGRSPLVEGWRGGRGFRDDRRRLDRARPMARVGHLSLGPAPREAVDAMALHTFRIGDLVQPEDELSLYLANLAVAFNDLVFTNVRMDEATPSWESFYWSRLAFAHFNEVMLYLEEKHGDADIAVFISRLPVEAQERYAEALRRYDENRGVVNRLRNETVFHYPKGKSVRAISRAFEQAQDDQGAAGSETSTKIKDARMFFADDLLARMVLNAAGGSEETYARLVEELAQAVRDLMKFTNAALGQLFIERLRDKPSG